MLSRFDKSEKILLALAVLGTGFMAYLTSLHFQEGGSSFCNFGAGFSCQVVNQSIYSELLGIPISILGLGYFVTVFALVAAKVRWAQSAIQLFTVGSLVFSFYLTYVEARLLATFCLFCEASKLLMLIILVLSVRRTYATNTRLALGHYVAAFAAGAVFTLVARYLQG